MFERTVELVGHIIDSMIMPKVLDTIIDLGADFDIEEVQIGHHKTDPSRARIRIIAQSPELLDRVLEQVQRLGAVELDLEEVRLEPAPKDGVFPLNFYSTTNLQTYVRYRQRWIPVERIEMDCGIVVDPVSERAYCIPVSDVRRGQLVAVGRVGIRVEPLERPRDPQIFGFMGSAVSSEKPKELVIAKVAEEMRQVRARGRKILVVGGPAIIHTGAGKYLEAIIRAGYVNVLFAGNALAAHDIESALYGTSLGVALDSGHSAEDGHEHHLRAINLIRYYGSIRSAVEAGVLRSGIMHACVTEGVDFVLAGSIRDDGPLPDVVTDVIEAQRAMRTKLEGVDMALLIATMLHSIAVGNLLPARVTTVCVDINPAVATKLSDRGSFQSISLVTDAESFLRELARQLLQRG
jgi:lysine-ketoglutarate reductase/saccharopine dehydrogenase-like protein (TIGR00300 family)